MLLDIESNVSVTPVPGKPKTSMIDYNIFRMVQ